MSASSSSAEPATRLPGRRILGSNLARCQNRRGPRSAVRRGAAAFLSRARRPQGLLHCT
jgi:hypothetical protein